MTALATNREGIGYPLSKWPRVVANTKITSSDETIKIC